MRWWRRVQTRTAISATLVVAAALAVLVAGLVLVQRVMLTDALVGLTRDQGALVAAAVAGSGTAGVDVIPPTLGDEVIVQALAPDLRVVAASPSIDGEAPIVSAGQPAGQVRTEVQRLPFVNETRYAVVVQGVATPTGDVTVVAARSLASVDAATWSAIQAGALAFPLGVLVVALVTYRAAGRALTPVEAMRRHVAEITAHGLSERVPDPGSGDEVSRLASTLNAMLTRLEVAAAGQRRFVSDASHELRSPLATIRVTAEVAATHPTPADWRTDAEVVLAEAARLEELVDALLLLARDDEHGLAIATREVDLADLVAQEAARLRRISPAGVGVELDQVTVRGDRESLSRAVRNLTDNAARYAMSRVDLRLSAHEGRAVLEVSDDGPGIPTDKLEAVFDRFARLDPSRDRDTGGSGLGLPIARAIARAHGGTLHAAPTPPGTGARFVLEVPLAAQPPSAASR